MAEEARRINAAHYFYLLKEDEESLGLLWSKVASDGDETSSQLGLTGPLTMGEARADRCMVLHHTKGGANDYCLAMLPNLAAIEVIDRSDNGPSRQGWLRFLARVDDFRTLSLEKGVSLFGESTLLVIPGGGDGHLIEEAADLVGSRVNASGMTGLPIAGEAVEPLPDLGGAYLASDLKPSLAGGDGCRLFRFPAPEPSSVSYWALAAADPEAMVTNLFPELDSRLQELTRAASYFRQQRESIMGERADIERKVGALLHKQVQTTSDNEPNTGELENRISSLSRMFGLLATDSLMARQADTRLGNDLELLRQNLTRLMDGRPGSRDEIGEYLLNKYSAELDAVRTVARDLDYSRQNAEAAIEVVRTQVELLRAREEAVIQEQTKGLLKQILRLQEEGLALQVAAGLIEFVLIFYYVLLSWEHIIGSAAAEHLTPFTRMLPILGIATGAALGTHFLARSIKNKTWRNPGLWVTGALLLFSLVMLIIISVTI